MGDTVLLKKNQSVRLNLQLSDGDLSVPKVVKADLRDHDGVYLTTINLTHVGGGLFKNDSYVMPDIPEMTAQYSVFENDGITRDITYSVDIDVFQLFEDKIDVTIDISNIIPQEEYIVEVEDHNEYVVEFEQESSSGLNMQIEQSDQSFDLGVHTDESLTLEIEDDNTEVENE